MSIKKEFSRLLWVLVALPLSGAGLAVMTTGCNSDRYMTYEDGEFDNDDTVSDQMMLNSELDLDSQEHD